MRVYLRMPGKTPEMVEVNKWPFPGIPAEGDSLEYHDTLLRVHSVTWYPFGSPDEGDPDPYVYIVLR